MTDPTDSPAIDSHAEGLAQQMAETNAIGLEQARVYVLLNIFDVPPQEAADILDKPAKTVYNTSYQAEERVDEAQTLTWVLDAVQSPHVSDQWGDARKRLKETFVRRLRRDREEHDLKLSFDLDMSEDRTEGQDEQKEAPFLEAFLGFAEGVDQEIIADPDVVEKRAEERKRRKQAFLREILDRIEGRDQHLFTPDGIETDEFIDQYLEERQDDGIFLEGDELDSEIPITDQESEEILTRLDEEDISDETIEEPICKERLDDDPVLEAIRDEKIIIVRRQRETKEGIDDE